MRAWRVCALLIWAMKNSRTRLAAFDCGRKQSCGQIFGGLKLSGPVNGRKFRLPPADPIRN